MIIKGLQKLTLLDYPGKIACTIFTAGCNMRCPYCHNGSLALGQGGEEISRDELLGFLRARVGRLDGVCISGGEPTLHPDLPELIADIKSLGYAVKLDTNGTNPLMLASLIADGLVDYIAMDIKNAPDAYFATCGVDNPGILAAVRESAELLMKGNVDFEFRTTVTTEHHNPSCMEKIGMWLCGEEKFYLQSYRDEGDLLVGGLTTPDAEEMKNMLLALRKSIPNAEIRL